MPAKLIRSFGNVTLAQQGCVMTIGNFDGVHLGHQVLINKVIEKAKELQAPSLLLTFEPHPFEYFSQQEVTIPRITRLREKFLVLSKIGIDNVLILPFNQEVATLSASDFIKQIQCKLQPKHMVVGDDFHFGYKRQGDFSLLKSMGDQLGFSLAAIHTECLQGERISSTKVRQALMKGELQLAETLLGRPYTMMGRVTRGDQRGRLFGFPTANIFLHRKLTPLRGVYTVRVHGIAGEALNGVANIGVRPTVDGTRTLLEVHLLDFNEDIYGRYVSVEFCAKLRDEMRYANIELLKARIAEDVHLARDYFHLK